MNFAIDYNNNLGIVYYNSYQIDQAISMFKKAVGLVLKVVQDQESKIEDVTANHRQAFQLKEASETCFRQCNTRNSTDGVLQEPDDYASFSHIQPDTPCSVFTYLEPFPLRSFGHSDTSSGLHCGSLVEVESSVAILFNLGLAYNVKHLYSHDSAFRQNSMKLYVLAYQFTHDVVSSLISHIQLCILNNVATLLHQIGQYQIASGYLHEMDELILDHYELLTDFGAKGCEFFTMNSLILVKPSTAPAA